jgi:hypothetical protein
MQPDNSIISLDSIQCAVNEFYKLPTVVMILSDPL